MIPYTGILQEAQTSRAAVVDRLSGTPDAAMSRRVSWRGQDCELRTLFYLLVEDDERRICRLQALRAGAGQGQTLARRILARGCLTRGQLRAALLAFPEPRLDETSAPDEWTVREVLGHCLNVEQRYLAQTLYAVQRLGQASAQPVRMPDTGLPPRVPDAPPAGTLPELLAQLDAIRASLIAPALAWGETELAAPTVWSTWDIDVAFRLHRFASHEREHTIQIAKTQRWLGHAPSEAQQILARAQEVRGELEGLLLGLTEDSAAAGILREASDEEALLALDITGLVAAG